GPRKCFCSSIWEGPTSGRCTITECAKASRKSSVKENCRRRNRWISTGESLRRIVPRWPGIVGGLWMTRRRTQKGSAGILPALFGILPESLLLLGVFTSDRRLQARESGQNAGATHFNVRRSLTSALDTSAPTT